MTGTARNQLRRCMSAATIGKKLRKSNRIPN
jgi:hypothetical protein